MSTRTFVLASASPARLRTLRSAGLDPAVIVSGFDEDALTAPTPAELVQVLADAKAAVVVEQISEPSLVLGCDSLLELDGVPLGKPSSIEDAIVRWHDMRGRPGAVHTGHCLIDTVSGARASATVSTVVRFADVSDAEIEAYCTTGEPVEVAGAFTLDRWGGWYVEGVEGDHHNVVGVSLPALRKLIHELGHTLADLGYPAKSGS